MSEAPSSTTTATPPARRSLLPFFFANLAAVYLPGLLPIFLSPRDVGAREDFESLRLFAIEFLNSPYRALELFFDGAGMFMLAPHVGNIASFYIFFFGLWLVVLGVTLAARNETWRHWVAFLLFVIFMLQAIFVTRQAIIEREAREAPRQVDELENDGPVLPGPRPRPAQP